MFFAQNPCVSAISQRPLVGFQQPSDREERGPRRPARALGVRYCSRRLSRSGSAQKTWVKIRSGGPCPYCELCTPDLAVAAVANQLAPVLRLVGAVLLTRRGPQRLTSDGPRVESGLSASDVVEALEDDDRGNEIDARMDTARGHSSSEASRALPVPSCVSLRWRAAAPAPGWSTSLRACALPAWP